MEWHPAGWSMSASVNHPLHHKVLKSSGTGSPGWSRKKGRKMVVCVCVSFVHMHSMEMVWVAALRRTVSRCHQQEHVGSRTLLQQNPPVLNWRCRLTQVVLCNGRKTVVVYIIIVVASVHIGCHCVTCYYGPLLQYFSVAGWKQCDGSDDIFLMQSWQWAEAQ